MTTDLPTLSTRLLAALERGGPNPALAWYGEAARIELSGHVLANWIIKSIGHLHDEIALEPGSTVVLDLDPHWKRLALALAAWSLGAEVTILDREATAAGSPGDTAQAARDASGSPASVPSAPDVVVTDRPDSDLAATAEEVLAVQAVSLAPRYDGELPALAHDWVTEVRSSSDRLGVVLPAWSGPAPDAERVEGGVQGGSPRLLVPDDGLAVLPAVLGALLAGGGIVGPAAAVTARQAQDETVTDRL